MRILVASIGHESNTFTPLPTTWEDFRVTYGEDILRRPRGSLAGIVDTLKANGLEPVPTISAHVLPGGVVKRDAFEKLRDGLLRGAENVNGACIFLHGAMRAGGEDYGDTALLSALRARLGPRAPITVALDLHGNITAEMVADADALVTYRTAPHVDTYETGVRAAELLLQALRGVKLTMGFAKVPILMPGEMAQTSVEPMASLMRMLEETDAIPGVLSSSFTKVHCWADVPDQGVCAVVVTDGDANLARAEADRLAQAFWERRAEFGTTVETYEVDEAIEVALAAEESTVFLSDSGDNPGAGGTTDIPFVLERMLEKGVEDAAIAAIWDPEAVETCVAAGVGETVVLPIGGKIDTIHGWPVRVSGRVHLISDGRWYREGIRREENEEEMGRLVVLSVGGIDVILSERRVSITDPEQMRAVGVEPLAYKMVVLKRGYLEPLFQAISPRSILMLSPGPTNCNVTRLDYERVRRPMYPLDLDAEWVDL
ncbi:MAG: M81 family metallopeptidase [Anaerolineae bacterium]|nr:M81 family metallopeptidase [Anaerolineae bacterium]